MFSTVDGDIFQRTPIFSWQYQWDCVSFQIIQERFKRVQSGEVDLNAKRKPFIDHLFGLHEQGKMTLEEVHYEINATIFGGEKIAESLMILQLRKKTSMNSKQIYIKSIVRSWHNSFRSVVGILGACHTAALPATMLRGGINYSWTGKTGSISFSDSVFI